LAKVDEGTAPIAQIGLVYQRDAFGRERHERVRQIAIEMIVRNRLSTPKFLRDVFLQQTEQQPPNPFDYCHHLMPQERMSRDWDVSRNGLPNCLVGQSGQFIGITRKAVFACLCLPARIDGGTISQLARIIHATLSMI
jgi:hypothetical protein